jgi:hydroxymethylpyrimidine/phosphomethylpyrimidine kinase
MQTARPYVLTVAGFDPSSGAGLTADVKTFEQLGVYGLAVCTALTLQTEDRFYSVEWRKIGDVKREVKILLETYPVRAVKFGIVPTFAFLKELSAYVKRQNPAIQIVIDPVWKSSTGFVLNKNGLGLDNKFLSTVTLLTPNVAEFELMKGTEEPDAFISRLRTKTSLLLKGGHNLKRKGVDTLYEKVRTTDYLPADTTVAPKHGSGCVLSAAIAAYLAKGRDVRTSCRLAKNYTTKFLKSNKSLLGFHAA